MITYLTEPDAFRGDEIVVEGGSYQHLFRARRLAVGAQVRVVDGEGRARWAEVAGVERRRARLALGDEAPSNEPDLSLELFVAALRSERASWLVEKATEIGVHAVRFVSTERTPRQYGDARLDRLRRVAGSAVEQSHRSRRPEISGVHPWKELPGLLADREPVLMLDTMEVTEASTVPETPFGAVLIGPEGGWSKLEREQLRTLGVRPLSWGSRVLRVETAALAAAAQLLLTTATP